MRPTINVLLGSVLTLLAWSTASAQLRIEITSGVSDPIPIAIPVFMGGANVDLAAVVQSDLDRSGRIRALARSSFPSAESGAAPADLQPWRSAGADFALFGRVTTEGNQWQVTVELVNVLTGQRLGRETLVGSGANPRMLAHRVSDWVFARLLGIPGAFATRIAYVSVDGAPPKQRFQLIVADSDGESARVILDTPQPIMSPAWSPDGQWLAYVSFETRSSAIYLQRVGTGERRRVSARAGVNGAPSWSADGQRLALTLSGSGGNLDVYVLDLATQALQRITDDPAIDTEPVFTADGAGVYFTSDRAGAPQIYRVSLGERERPKRVSFTGGYNARPRLSPDGKLLAMVTLDNGAYRIAVLDLATNVSRIVSRGRFDESPAFAPNSATLIYAGRQRGQGVLATVSVDGLISQQLKADRGEVREPVFGPHLR